YKFTMSLSMPPIAVATAAKVGEGAQTDLALNTLFDSAPMGILLTQDRLMVRANPMFAEMMHCTLDNLLGQPASILWPDMAAYAELGRMAGPVLAGGGRFQAELQARRQDGTLFWCRFSAKAVDHLNPQYGTLWFMEDTTEAHDNAERVQRTFEEQQMIFDNTAVGIMFVTRRKVARCNRRMAAIFGYEPEELLGKSTRIFYDSEEGYRTLGMEGYATILAGKAYVHEREVAHKNGTRIWVRATGRQAPMSKPGEDVIWIFEEVSEQRRAQAALIQAEKLASLGALVAGVAHELNTPIGNAMMSASTLQDSLRGLRTAVENGTLRRSTLDKFLSDSVEISDLVLRSCDRASHLVSSFKQVAVDQTSEQRRCFELGSLVDDIVATLQPMFRHEPWSMVLDVAPGLQCDSYPGPLGQVIANLINNASAHAFVGRSKGVLHIHGGLVDGHVVMKFVDDGQGMEPGTVARIFDPFFTTRMGQGGSGLGLSISKNIASGLLGGSLGVTSQPGIGSCFTLTFPSVAPDAVQPPAT
ncbi:MAG: PAS domain-containing sensor histidine kinase, partial [Rhodoferax sp.]